MYSQFMMHDQKKH